MASVNPSQKGEVFLRYALISPTGPYGLTDCYQFLKIFISAKSHPPIIELWGKIGHGIYASFLGRRS
jgi:hypothetical protein